MKTFVQEYAFIQRTGESIIDLGQNKDDKNSNENQEELALNLNKLVIKGNVSNEPDEDGWVEVKKKPKK